MLVKASRAYAIFKKNRGIDSAELEEDIIRIEEFYRDNGYLNVRVSDVQREPVGDKVNLVIQVVEGKKFTINSVSVSGIKAVSANDVLPLLEMKEGAVYSSKGIQTDLTGLRRYYADNGYSGVRIRPSIDSASETTVNIEVNFSEQHPLPSIGEFLLFPLHAYAAILKSSQLFSSSLRFPHFRTFSGSGLSDHSFFIRPVFICLA